jgi:hypothetical protein
VLAKSKLEDGSTAICGAEILRLAKTHGKGWFALLLSEQVSYRTCIPSYILGALHFAAPDIKISSIVKSINYRIDSIIGNDGNPLKKQAEEFKRNFVDHKPQDYIESFKAQFKNDQLTKFLNQA